MLYLAVATDVFHAFLMILWTIGLPLLFWRKYPKLSYYYYLYCIVFILVNQASHYILGECIFTTIANWFYTHAHTTNFQNEWFTMRVSRAVFGIVPSHRGVKIATQIMVGLTALGGLYSLYKVRQEHKVSHDQKN
jgi:hypothetical protein